MGFLDTAAAVLVGNLFAVWFLFGLHFVGVRGDHTGAKWAVGGTCMAMSGTLAIATSLVGEPDPFADVITATFVASLFTVALIWGGYTIVKHEERGDISTAPLRAWVAVLAPIAVAITWLWPYAPIG